jgi:hypothetical protein
MVPVWRVFENPRINQLVYTISVVAGVAAGVWRLGWWGVPVGVVVVFGVWQVLVLVLWRRRGKPREPNRFGPESRAMIATMKPVVWWDRVEERAARIFMRVGYGLVMPAILCGVPAQLIHDEGVPGPWAAGAGIAIGGTLTGVIFWARRRGWVTFDGDGTGIGP